MSLKCGIVGLPNVGKSTLFNALTQTEAAQAENYAFCTIEPNVGKVVISDERLDELSKIANSEKIIPAQITFVDIAGLVKGASKGEGLGNKFLSHIREVDAIINVVRCFEDDDISHVESRIDPVGDIELIQTELILSDLEMLEKVIPNLEKKLKVSLDKELKIQLELAKKSLALLSSGKCAILLEISDDEEKRAFKNLQLITSKPQLFVCNLSEDEVVRGNIYSDLVKKYGENIKCPSLNISAKLESEIASFEDDSERLEFLSSVGLRETGLSQVARIGYNILGLITFFTVGPKECRAWSVKNGSVAPNAAGVIHSDFEKGFIKAEAIAYDDYIKYNGEDGCKDAGKLRIEGKSYIVQDGDVFHFKFNL